MPAVSGFQPSIRMACKLPASSGVIVHSGIVARVIMSPKRVGPPYGVKEAPFCPSVRIALNAAPLPITSLKKPPCFAPFATLAAPIALVSGISWPIRLVLPASALRRSRLNGLVPFASFALGARSSANSAPILRDERKVSPRPDINVLPSHCRFIQSCAKAASS